MDLIFRRKRIRVLFINTRGDSNENPGGDNVQFVKTRAAVESRGVTVVTHSALEASELPAFDLAHLFNIQMPEAAGQVFEVLREMDKPIVLSPIYWDMFEHWAEMAFSERLHWRTMARLLGRRTLRMLYVSWQKAKAPCRSQWRSQRSLLEQADRVLPNSWAEVELMKRTFLLGPGFRRRTAVVVNGIDHKLFARSPQPHSGLVDRYGLGGFVLQVGSINPVKNQLGLIKALFDSQVPLVFVGKPQTTSQEYYDECRATAKRRGNVLFLGRVPHEELSGIYAAARVHVMPSWRETPGLVSLEAAAAGCQIVTTSIGSAQEYFRDLAWYCHPADLSSIKRAVFEALNAQSSPALRRLVLREYTWEQAGETTVAAYRKVLTKW